MKHQWVPFPDKPGRKPVELWVLGKKKYHEGDEGGMHRLFSIEVELARVRLVSARTTKWEWEAAGKTGMSFTGVEPAQQDAEDTLRAAGVEF